MGLKKGMTNNRNGRKKGAVNRLSKDMRQTITDFLQDHWPEVEKEFSKLKGRDKVNFYRDLLQYAIPKMQAVAVTGEINFKTLSEDQLDELADKLYNKKRDE